MALKKITPYLTLLLIIIIAIVLFLSMTKNNKLTATIDDNTQKQPIEIIPNKFTDVQCAMTIVDIQYACEVISPSGKTWFFDDIGCLVLWLEDKSFKDEAVLWVKDLDSDKWIDARKAWYSLTNRTPMHYGFAAHVSKKEDVIDFKTMRIKMLQGENLTNPKIRKKLLGI